MHRIVTVSLAYSVTILQKGIHQQQFRLESPFESSIKASGKDTSDPPPVSYTHLTLPTKA